MQNPSINKASNPLHEISESVKETIDKKVPELRSKVKGMVFETTENLTKTQRRARGWIEQNYGKTLGIVGVIAAIGGLGYIIGRNNSKQEELWTPKEAA